jgi:predicted TPR repeat methyltransferase
MNSSNPQSLSTEFFEQLYQENPDPWQFATSEYEAKKYATTLNALPHNLYQAGFEIGGSIGILTEKLARRCQSLLSVDVSQIAQAQAIDRCQQLNNIKFELMSVPESFPTECFDLIVLSEVGYYWSWEDLHTAQGLIVEGLRPQGHLLLVHWTVDRGILPLTGDEVHDDFLRLVPDQLKRIKSLTEDTYRLDLFEKI